MKRTFLTLLIAIGFAGFTMAQTDAKIELSGDGGAIMSLEKTQHDFGNIKEGTQATVTFKFKNTGTEPLLLSSVQASCGCTTPKWTKEPIAPGATGEIIAIYNSTNRPGKFTKTITVKYNGEGGTEYLTITGFVESKPKEASPPSIQATPK
ncbi:MAG: hypothetical protein ACI8ZN_000018 [Bacteroidia bacterium]|jgi:hypothetical protein